MNGNFWTFFVFREISNTAFKMYKLMFYSEFF